MAYKSKFTGAEVDAAIEQVRSWKNNPSTIMTSEQILANLTGQQIIDKINSVSGNIVFTKFVDAQGGAGNTK